MSLKKLKNLYFFWTNKKFPRKFWILMNFTKKIQKLKKSWEIKEKDFNL